MLVSFDKTVSHSIAELRELRNRTEHPVLFDKAVAAMHKEKWRFDTSNGITRNRNGVVSRFAEFRSSWGAQYDANPGLVFHDVFRPNLCNKYSRLVRGLSEKE